MNNDLENGLSLAGTIRVIGWIVSLASLAILFRVTWVGCVDRSIYYDTKYSNTISITTPGASVPLATHADLAQRAMNDVEALGLQSGADAVLALTGTIILSLARRVT